MTLLDQVHVSSRSKVLPTPPRHTPWYQDALWVLPSSPLALLYLRFQSTSLYPREPESCEETTLDIRQPPFAKNITKMGNNTTTISPPGSPPIGPVNLDNPPKQRTTALPIFHVSATPSSGPRGRGESDTCRISLAVFSSEEAYRRFF
ncbi:hypothetical protein PIIN_08303 [Serendipita indica DSM 11827]|uniref:Uncharacterized protein n=1 Tax=Serendipita indica (strain DSM 11827) TaxID=1109443 RepID=G4TSQ7_SERID|nr:hypothetical protein PIIN_08303 [Serendipita indica DSM 11827]